MHDPRFTIAHRVRQNLLYVRHHQQAEQLDRARAFHEQLTQLDRLQRQAHVACHRHYHGALSRLVRRIQLQLRDLHYQLEQARRVFDQPIPHVLSLRQIVRELDQLDEEFGPWDWDGREKILSVTTAPIELEGVYLGPFAIRLKVNELDRIPRRSGFDCVATDPHPASSDDSVTHPHVSHDGLCTGDATTSLYAALHSGRLGDFFLIVRQVLSTYNDQSPYIPLDQWEGNRCAECGYTVGEEDRCTCLNCEQDFCRECVSRCVSCRDMVCRSCQKTCPSCDSVVCDSCLDTCAACGRDCCESCLEDDLCPDCHQEQQENERDSTEEQASTATA